MDGAAGAVQPPQLAPEPARRQFLVRIVSITLTLFVFLWLASDTVEPSQGGKSGSNPSPIGPDDPSLVSSMPSLSTGTGTRRRSHHEVECTGTNDSVLQPYVYSLQPAVRQLAAQIAAASKGLVYPSNLTSDRFIGKWTWAGNAKGRFLRPVLAPNVTVQYALAEPHAQSNLSFVENQGDIIMKMQSSPPYLSVPTLQDVVGELAVFDGDAKEGKSVTRLAVPCKGVYAADQGLLYLIGSTTGGRIGLNLGPLPSSSPSSSPSPVASPSPSPTSTASREAEASATASASAVASSSSGPEGTPKGLASSPTASASQGVRQLAETGVDVKPDRCDLLIALRFRPTDFDSNWVPQPPTQVLHRRMLEMLQEQGSVGNELLWPVALSAISGVSDSLLVSTHGGASSASSASGRAGSSRETGRQFGNAFVPRFIREVVSVDGSASASSLSTAQEGGGVGAFQHVVDAVDSWAAQAEERASAMALSAATQETVSEIQQDLLAVSGRRLLDTSGFALPRQRRLTSTSTANQYAGMRYLPMRGHIVSPNCNFSMNVSTVALVYSYPALESKLSNFAFLATSGGIALLLVTTYQIILSSSSSGAARLSVTMVGMQWVLDGMTAFLFMAAGVVATSLAASFAIAALAYFFLFVVVEVRMMLLIRKAQVPEAFVTGSISLQRELCKLYILLYPALICTFFLLYSGSAGTVRLLMVIAYSYWVPQIMHNAARDSRSGLTRGYILTATLARLLPMAYLLMCPYNAAYMLWPSEGAASALAWSGSDDPQAGKQPWMINTSVAPALLTPARAAVFWSWARFGLGLIAWQVVQVAFLLLQSKPGWGPRFFVPYAFLPVKYNYHRRIVVSNGRIVPDAAATAEWVRHPLIEETPPPPGAEGGDGAAAAGAVSAGATASGIIGSAFRSAARDAVSSIRSTRDSAAWFAAGCRLLARDAYKWGTNALHRRLRTARDRPLEDSIGRSMSGAPPPPNTDGAAHPQASASGQGGSWLDLMSPRQRVVGGGGGGPLGSVQGRYSRLGVGDGSMDEGPLASGGGVGHVPLPGSSASAESYKVGQGQGGLHSLVAQEEGRAGPDSAQAAGGAGQGGGGGQEEDCVGDPSWQPLDCVICMDAVAFPCASRRYMVTPCDHVFHAQCLRPWMEHKVECPTCRMQLPEP